MAQDAAPAGGGGGRRGGGAMAMGKMTEGLNLTPDQQKTVDSAQSDAMTKMKALREDTSTDQKAKRKQMMEITRDTQEKIRAVLTDDQKTKFDANIAAAREQMKARRQGGAGGGDNATPPPPPAS